MAIQTGVLDAALARASAGDEAAFLQLWRALQPPLLRFLRVVGCDDPDDVASETWLQVVRDLHRFTGGEEDFRRWLFTIGRHRAIDAARARSRRPATPVSTGLEILADSQLVEEQVLDGMSVERAVGLLAGLSRDQAEVVALRIIAGLDTPDVARILGKSAGAVRVALHRGLRTLADDPSVRALADLGRSPVPSARQAAQAETMPIAELHMSADPARQAVPPGITGQAGPADPPGPAGLSFQTLEEVE